MTTATLKKKLHEAIDTIDDPSLLRDIMTMMNFWQNEPEKDELSPEQKKQLDAAISGWKKGTGKLYSWKETKQVVAGAIKKRRAG